MIQILIRKLLLDFLISCAVIPYILIVFGYPIDYILLGVFTLIFGFFDFCMHQVAYRAKHDPHTNITYIDYDKKTIYYEVINFTVIDKNGNVIWLDGTGVPLSISVNLYKFANRYYITEREFNRLFPIQRASQKEMMRGKLNS